MSENDPLNIEAHAPGAKLDAGKLRLGLIIESFPRALQEVAKVADFGARKYSRGGWQHVPEGEDRYHHADLRHMIKAATGELLDPDSGLLHEAHRAWNVLARLELMLRRGEVVEEK